MADANTLPRFILAYREDEVTISTANTNRDGTGTIGIVFTAGAQGSRIDRITVTATGTTTAGMVRLYVHDSASFFFWREISVSAITPSATVKAFTDELDLSALPLFLASGFSLRASTHNAESFNVHAAGGDF